MKVYLLFLVIFTINASDGALSLIKSIKDNNDELAKALLITHRCEVDYQDEDGKTALMHACALGNISIIKLLLIEGANTRIKCNNTDTALMYSYYAENIEAFLLISLFSDDKHVMDITAIEAGSPNSTNPISSKLMIENSSGKNIYDVLVEECRRFKTHCISTALSQKRGKFKSEMVQYLSDPHNIRVSVPTAVLKYHIQVISIFIKKSLGLGALRHGSEEKQQLVL